MKDDIRQKTCVIVERNGQYLVGRILGSKDLRWSISPYDAWMTRDVRAAKNVAKLTGGVTVLFNPIVKQMKVL